MWTIHWHKGRGQTQWLSCIFLLFWQWDLRKLHNLGKNGQYLEPGAMYFWLLRNSSGSLALAGEWDLSGSYFLHQFQEWDYSPWLRNYIQYSFWYISLNLSGLTPSAVSQFSPLNPHHKLFWHIAFWFIFPYSKPKFLDERQSMCVSCLKDNLLLETVPYIIMSQSEQQQKLPQCFDSWAPL